MVRRILDSAFHGVADMARLTARHAFAMPLSLLRLASQLVSIAMLAFATAFSAHAAAGASGPGAVYALTNSPAGNAVVAYHRSADGTLTFAGTYSTGGSGTGAGLGSQGAVVVSDDRRFLLAVNAGSNSVSSFRVLDHGALELADAVPSGGTMPTSVAIHGNSVYVLNAGAPNNIIGFHIADNGALTPIVDSTRPLSAAATSPAQVSFNRDGDTLIVTERAVIPGETHSHIDTYAVNEDGTTEGPNVFASAGPTPFGFAVGLRNTLVVSEAGAGGGASAYRINDEGGLDPASSMIMTGQRAACWAAVTPNGRFGYVTNAGTGNISGLAIAPDGTATLLDADGITAVTGGNPTDMAMSRNGQYLYARVAALNAIAIFRVQSDGSLVARTSLTGTPAGLAGLAGY
jgi:6-phosphogluconolactonase (cycloisomerase 2 family)